MRDAFAEVSHQEWIAAPVELVRAQFADLRHHIHTNVHPKLRFQVLLQEPGRARFVQEVRLLGIRQRDVFERVVRADGSMIDTSIEGFNKGGTLEFHFHGDARDGRAGTRVDVTIRLPLPPVIGRLLRGVLCAQIRRELRAAVAEDKYDLEVRGYHAPALVAG
ncbi:MAG: SRPBCC family protein [Burkholderiaceae bacterium]|nr:SRPBCC family protein [Burkholderiaceae bacterium]